MFIWCNDYSDDSEDNDDNDGDGDYSASEDNIWGEAWRRRSDPLDALHTNPTREYSSRSAFDGLGSALYEAVRKYTNGPDDIERLRALSTDSAVDAFRRIVIGLLGNVPSDTYEVVVSCDRGGIYKLMQSSLSTGYALRNAEFRMTLNETMHGGGGGREECHDLFTSDCEREGAGWRRGVVRKSGVHGTVQWWNGDEGTEEMKVKDYVALLEAENELLRERLAARQMHDANNNRLMDFMRTLKPEKIGELQASLSVEAADAFKMIMTATLGELNGGRVQMTYSTSRDYVGQLTLWCLLVGYCVRNVEKRMEMGRVFANERRRQQQEASVSDVDS